MARVFEKHVAKARHYVRNDDGETALMHLRIAAEAWGRFYQQAQDAIERGDADAKRLLRLRERDGERILALEGEFAEHFLNGGPPPRPGLWTRLTGRGKKSRYA